MGRASNEVFCTFRSRAVLEIVKNRIFQSDLQELPSQFRCMGGSLLDLFENPRVNYQCLYNSLNLQDVLKKGKCDDSLY